MWHVWLVLRILSLAMNIEKPDIQCDSVSTFFLIFDSFWKRTLNTLWTWHIFFPFPVSVSVSFEYNQRGWSIYLSELLSISNFSYDVFLFNQRYLVDLCIKVTKSIFIIYKWTLNSQGRLHLYHFVHKISNNSGLSQLPFEQLPQECNFM